MIGLHALLFIIIIISRAHIHVHLRLSKAIIYYNSAQLHVPIANGPKGQCPQQGLHVPYSQNKLDSNLLIFFFHWNVYQP